MIRRTLTVALLAASLAGCAARGSQSLNDDPQMLADTPDDKLCVAWARSSEGEFPNIDAEAVRRGLNCRHHPAAYFACAGSMSSPLAVLVDMVRRRCP